MVMKYIEKECEGKCPACNSELINYHVGGIQDETYIYDAICLSCNTEFTEEFTLQYNFSTMVKEESK